MNNRLSIIMPAYNAEKHILRAIRSIQTQIYKDWDLIIINDGSTDRTQFICEDLCRNDKRIHLINQRNKGYTKALETGVHSTFAQANSMVTFVDSDDALTKNSLQILVDTYQKYNADVCCGVSVKTVNGFMLPKNGVPPCFNINEPRLYKSGEIAEELIDSFFGNANFPVTLWGKLFDYRLIAENIGTADIVHFTGGDLIVILNEILKAERLVLIPDVVYKYRIGGGSSKHMPYLSHDL